MSIKLERREAMRIAKQLCYGSEVIDSLAKAKTDYEISHILHRARLA
jgi:hypothetical protein